MCKQLELNEPNGATLDDSRDAQQAFFTELKKYNLAKDLENGCDYFLMETIGGVFYYGPNDEEWGCVIAVDYVNELAVDTGFYETDDFEDFNIKGEIFESDYRMVLHDGKLMCKFSSE